MLPYGSSYLGMRTSIRGQREQLVVARDELEAVGVDCSSLVDKAQNMLTSKLEIQSEMAKKDKGHRKDYMRFSSLTQQQVFFPLAVIAVLILRTMGRFLLPLLVASLNLTAYGMNKTPQFTKVNVL